MADWWNSRFDENYEKRKKEIEESQRRTLKRLEDQESQIELTSDPIEKLRLRRERYVCESFVTIQDLVPWSDRLCELEKSELPAVATQNVTVSKTDISARFPPDASLNKKVFLYQGDITELEVDGIVNAANSSLLGGGGIDGAIHGAAGPLLLKECRTLNGCETGSTKVTKGYCLPAKYVLHTVGPFGKGDSKLQRCYKTCLEEAHTNNIRTLAFCCVGTGIYSFPLVRAAHIALRCVREWMDLNPNALDAVIFCVFQNIELDVYTNLLCSYFPSETFPGFKAEQEHLDAVPINENTIAIEEAAAQREAERHRLYYARWVANSPGDEDIDP